MTEFIIFILLMGIGYFSGRFAEKRHYKDIRRRERQTLTFPVSSFGAKQPLPQAQESEFFVAAVVISSDYFLTFVMSLRNLVGGRVVASETLLDRGRREALLRLKEQAIAWGATELLNVRYETSTISGNQKGLVGVDIIVYGTGIR